MINMCCNFKRCFLKCVTPILTCITTCRIPFLWIKPPSTAHALQTLLGQVLLLRRSLGHPHSCLLHQPPAFVPSDLLPPAWLPLGFNCKEIRRPKITLKLKWRWQKAKNHIRIKFSLSRGKKRSVSAGLYQFLLFYSSSAFFISLE